MGRIMDLLEKGWSEKKIAEKIGHSISEVWYWLDKKKENR